MRKLPFIFLVIICGCAQRESRVESLFPKGFQEKLQQFPNAVLIDARTKDEMNVEFIKGAVLLDSGKPNLAMKLDSLDKSLSYFVYCGRGVRSLTMLQLMREKGFTQLYHLRGGIERWKQRGLPVETGITK